MSKQQAQPFRTARRLMIAAGVCVSLVATGCGSTRDDRGAGQAASPASEVSPGGSTAAPAPDQAVTSEPGAAASVPAPDAATTPSGASPTPKAGSAATPTPQAAARAGRGEASSGGGTSGAAPTSGGGPAAATPTKPGGAPAAPTPSAPGTPAPAGGSKSEIVLASVGTYSGILGEILREVPLAARAWVADVNARGGLNGHPVRLIAADDGGDPAKALALARRMVEQDKAIALYAQSGTGTMQAVLPYLEEKKIPSIGGCNCSAAEHRSPMAFQVGPGDYYGTAWAHLAPAVAAGVKKAAFIYCSESAACDIRKPVSDFARASGIEIVYSAQITLTQPDYTAQILAARNAGAEAIIAFVDSASLVRAERSAHRQNWHPIFTTQWSGHEQRLIEAGGTDVEGVHIGAATPHWDGPKLADYRAALRRYVPGARPASWGVMQWAAGKLLELLAQNFPDQTTSADILKGLLGLRGETLGGLAAPLTYGGGPDGGTFRTACVVVVKVQGGKFVPLNGDNFNCAPGFEPK